MENIYYVYAYLNSNGLPYYIGKGKDTRAYDYHENVELPNDLSKIVFLGSRLSEKQAFNLENQYITKFGREDLSPTGLLKNKAGGITNKSTKEKRPQMRRITMTQIENEIDELIAQLKTNCDNKSKMSSIRRTIEDKRKVYAELKHGRRIYEPVEV